MRGGTPMLDRPEKTEALLDAMEQALPFEAGLMPELIAGLAGQQRSVAVKPVETVTDISYAGDEGGIMCHIAPSDADSMVVVSLTHVRVPRTLPFAGAALAYQKHRVKKLKKQH
jgi:hypothetical protein